MTEGASHILLMCDLFSPALKFLFKTALSQAVAARGGIFCLYASGFTHAGEVKNAANERTARQRVRYTVFMISFALKKQKVMRLAHAKCIRPSRAHVGWSN